MATIVDSANTTNNIVNAKDEVTTPPSSSVTTTNNKTNATSNDNKTNSTANDNTTANNKLAKNHKKTPQKKKYENPPPPPPMTEEEINMLESPSKESVRWTPEEDEMLRAAVALYKGKNWKKISDCFGAKKTEVQCLQHWRNVLNPCVVKGKGSWTPEEDLKLRQLVQKYGKTKWSYIGKFLPGRIGKQCRERWHNHLNPDLTKKAWTKEEEDVIIEIRAKLGNRWAKIARMLPGRSDNDVKNRWYASLRKKVEGPTETEKRKAAEKKERKNKAAKKKAAAKAAQQLNNSNKSANSKKAKKKANNNNNNNSRVGRISRNSRRSDSLIQLESLISSHEESLMKTVGRKRKTAKSNNKNRSKASPTSISNTPDAMEKHLPPRKRTRMINANLIDHITNGTTPMRHAKVWDRPTIPGLESIWTSPESSGAKDMDAAFLLAGLGSCPSPRLGDVGGESKIGTPTSKKAFLKGEIKYFDVQQDDVESEAEELAAAFPPSACS